MTNKSMDSVRNVDRISTSNLRNLRASTPPTKESVQKPRVDVFDSKSFNDMFKNL